MNLQGRALLVAALLMPMTASAASARRSIGEVNAAYTPSYASFSGNRAHGRIVASARCAACHGTDGNGAARQYPKLAGQDPSYLYRQTLAFKTRARTSDVMTVAIQGLSDADLADAAAYYAGQSIRPDAVNDASLASTGERIYFSGSGNAPACVACHGPDARGGSPTMGGKPMGGMMGHGMMGGMPMMGMGHGMMGGAMSSAHVPNLGDQHADYIVDQLNRFAGGNRPGTVMPRIAASLSGEERKAVAEFLSGLR